MAKTRCVLCGKIIPIEEGRSGHLIHKHGIERYKGMVKDYYEEP